MKKAFNAKAVQASSVDIIQKHYDPNLDGYLMLGKVRDTGEFFVAWKSRHKENLVDGKSFETEAAAAEYYKKLLDDGDLTARRSLTKDFQKQAVYDWEDDSLLPRGAKITEKEARALIRKIAHDYDVPVPDLEWEEFTNVSGYDDDTIYMGARDNISLLHEMAHHLHEYKVIGDDELPPHSPGFVAIALALYHRYAGIDLAYLNDTAQAKNILGDALKPAINPTPVNEKEKPAPRPPRSLGPLRPAAYAHALL